MNLTVEGFVLRAPEPDDVPALYSYRNDAEVASALGGFSHRLSKEDLLQWVEFHRRRSDECVWVIAEAGNGKCVGHVGLYEIDYRIRKAEFAICIGEKALWGKGLGERITRAVLDYGFRQLNLHRIELSVLETNARALRLYESMGFDREGVLRDAQFKNGRYISVILMAVFQEDWSRETQEQ